MDLQKRINMERMIATATILEVLKAGFAISVNNGEETTVNKSTNAWQILDAMFSTDEDYLRVHCRNIFHGGFEDEYRIIYFVCGNDGYDVIQDNSSSLDVLLQPINTLSDQMQESIHG